jgi:hypothetical protein
MRISKGLRNFCLPTLLCAQMASAAQNPFSISITGPSQVRVGEAARIRVRITNITTNLITFSETAVVCDYKIEVRDQGGALVQDTPMKHQFSCSGGLVITARNMLVMLRPRESYEEAINLSEWNNMTAPGSYTVRVGHRRNDGNRDIFIESNKITIAVLPANNP